MKKIICALMTLILCGCSGDKAVNVTSYDYFDTVTYVKATGVSEDELNGIFLSSYARLNDVFDIYGPHEGVNGLYAINEAAGTPVRAESDIIELIDILDYLNEMTGNVDITQGALFSKWHDFREGGDMPEYGELVALRALGGRDKLVIEGETVAVLSGSIDMGAVAKGYAAGKLAEAIRDGGASDFVISAGGNVVVGKRDKPYVVGVSNPEGGDVLLKLNLTDTAAVTSGGYQRYRDFEGKRYHHIIDVNTMYPADTGIAQVTVIDKSSMRADFLSTAIYLMTLDEGKAFCEKYAVAAIWVTDGGEIVMTDSAKGMIVE